MRRAPLVLVLLALAFGLLAWPGRPVSRTAVHLDFVHFESSHGHPLAMTPDGSRRGGQDPRPSIVRVR